MPVGPSVEINALTLIHRRLNTHPLLLLQKPRHRGRNSTSLMIFPVSSVTMATISWTCAVKDVRVLLVVDIALCGRDACELSAVHARTNNRLSIKPNNYIDERFIVAMGIHRRQDRSELRSSWYDSC